MVGGRLWRCKMKAKRVRMCFEEVWVGWGGFKAKGDMVAYLPRCHVVV